MRHCALRRRSTLKISGAGANSQNTGVTARGASQHHRRRSDVGASIPSTTFNQTSPIYEIVQSLFFINDISQLGTKNVHFADDAVFYAES